MMTPPPPPEIESEFELNSNQLFKLKSTYFKKRSQYAESQKIIYSY